MIPFSRLLFTAFSCLAALASSTSVAAQPDAVSSANPPLQFGPLSLYPAVGFKNIGIDSNVFNETGQPRDDFTATINPKLLARLRLGAAGLSATSSSDFVYFQTFKEEQAINTHAGARFEVGLSRFHPFASADLARTRERAGVEIDARARRSEQTLGAGFDLDLTSITAVTLSARRQRIEYGAAATFLGIDLDAVLSRTAEVVSGGVRIQATPLTRLVVMAEAARDRFRLSPGRDADSIRVEPALEFHPAAVVTGRAAVGYRRFVPRDARIPDYRGVVARVNLVYTLLGVTKFDIQADRDVEYSFEPHEPYYLSTGGRLEITQRIAGPFDVIATAGHQRLQYRALNPASADGRRDTFDSLGAGVGLRLGSALRVTVNGDFAERRTSVARGRAYERTRIFSSVLYGF